MVSTAADGKAAGLLARRDALTLAAGWCAAAMLVPVSACAAASRPLDYLMGVFVGRTVGSAFALAPGLAVTNAHVVAGLRPGARVTLATATGRGPFHARVLAASGRMDVAVLELSADVVAPVSGRNAAHRAGLAVRAAGLDAGSPRGSGLQLQGSILQTGVRLLAHGSGTILRLPGVRPGFSGGPVLDAQGHLVGMVTSIRHASGDRQVPLQRAAFAPVRSAEADEAFVLHAAGVRDEVARLTAALRQPG